MVRDRLNAVRRQVRALLRRSAVEREMAEEFAFHLQMEVEQNLRRGMDPESARRAALLEFGGVERFGERVRESRRSRILEDLMTDVRHALRTLARRPGFAAAVVATLGLGIGGTTAVFSVTDALFLRGPGGVHAAAELVTLWVIRDEGAIRTPQGGPGSYLDYEALRDGARGLSGVAPYLGPRPADMGRGPDAERIRVRAVGHAFLPLLGVGMARGRAFTAEEDGAAGAAPVVVISNAFWQRLGADPDIVGRTLVVNDEALTVIGVTERAFTGLDVEPDDMLVTLAMAARLGLVGFGGEADWRQVPAMTMVNVIGRLAPGADLPATIASATAALRHAAAAAPELDQTPDVVTSSIIPGRALHRGAAATLSLWLLVVAALVLAIACANVLGLLLARTTARRRELSVRLSLGAGRGRIVRQQLTETLVLALLGGAAGVLIAYWGAGIARQFPLPPAADGMNGRVLLFALAVALLTGLLVGVLPAVRAAGADAAAGLKDARGGLAPSRARLRRALVLGQVTLSVLLLVGAGLFIRSLRAVHAIDAQVDIERLLFVTVDLGRAGYTPDEREEFYAAARSRVESLPGVQRTAMSHFGPFAGAAMSMPVHVEEHGSAEPLQADVDWVGPGYFETAGTRIVAGRAVTEADRDGPEPVMVVNDVVARAIAPAGSAVGRCIPIGNQPERGVCTRVIGVARSQRRRLLEPPETPLIYLARERNPHALAWGGPVLLVRTDAAGAANAAAAAQVRAALQGMRPDLPYVRVQPVSAVIRNEVLPYRLGATLFGLFGALALALTAVGLFGVLSFYVTERRAEIGIRRSLGATGGAVLALLARQGAAPLLGGLVLGLAAAAAGTRLLAALIYGISPLDPATYVAASLFLLAVALAATVLPARRAAAVDPMVALRAE